MTTQSHNADENYPVPTPIRLREVAIYLPDDSPVPIVVYTDWYISLGTQYRHSPPHSFGHHVCIQHVDIDSTSVANIFRRREQPREA